MIILRLSIFSRFIEQNLCTIRERTSQAAVTNLAADELFVIGNGGNNSLERSNAMMVDIEGNARLSGDIYVQTENDSTGGYRLMSEANVATVAETLEIIREYDGVGV